MWRCRCKASWTCSCSPDSVIGLRLRRAGRRLRQRTGDRAASEIDLEDALLQALGVAKREIRGAAERRPVGGLPAQRCLCCRVTPRLVRHTAERETGLLDRVALELQCGRDRDERERIREAIADFQGRNAPGTKLDAAGSLIIDSRLFSVPLPQFFGIVSL
jgi:hypothetical protein